MRQYKTRMIRIAIHFTQDKYPGACVIPEPILYQLTKTLYEMNSVPSSDLV